MNLEELKAKLDTLSPIKTRFVANVVDSLSNPPRPSIQEPGTWITCSADWIEYFGLAISIHHGTTTEPLGLTAFETVFRNACKAVQWRLEPQNSSTQRFIDLVVQADESPHRKLSLKSTSAKNISKTKAHISKLTEAAWIQDERTASNRKRRTLELFREYQQAVDSIIMLRAFRKNGEVPKCYQLLEIPTSIFDSIQHASDEAFQRDAPVIECCVGGQTVARVAIDRSDAKITVRSILLSACTVHAEWSQPTPLGI